MALPARFTTHPATVGETYGEHLVFALRFASDLAKRGRIKSKANALVWLPSSRSRI